MVITGAACLIGARTPFGGVIAYTSFIHDNYRLGILSVDRGMTSLLPASYRPYQNFYGWSADGRLTFLSDRDGNTEVYLWDWANYHNISQHPFNDWRPAISRDGRVALASERDGNMEIYVWAEGSLTNVSLNSGADDYPVWSPDGRLAWINDTNGNARIEVWDGTGIEQIFDTPWLIKDTPQWTADGRLTWFEWLGSSEITFVSSDGEAMTRSELMAIMDPDDYAWSADGRLAFVQAGDIHVWDGQNEINLTRGPAQEYSPAWSSDGRLLFLSNDSMPGLYLWDGQSIRLLLKGNSLSGPVWMP